MFISLCSTQRGKGAHSSRAALLCQYWAARAGAVREPDGTGCQPSALSQETRKLDVSTSDPRKLKLAR
jgi:hypothetical protein